MFRKTLFVLALKVFIPSLLFAAPEIELPPNVAAAWPGFVTLTAKTTQKEVVWFSVSPEFQLVPAEILKDSKYALGSASRPGRYMVLAWTAEGGVPSKPAVCWVTVGDPAPTPPIPVPPTPLPPTPVPPIPAPMGFRVILVHESNPMPTTAEEKKALVRQHNMLHSLAVEEYLTKKCIGGRAGWKRWDQNIDVSNADATWQSLWKASKPIIVTTKLPAIVVAKDQVAEVYSIADLSEQQLLDFLKMFGGH
jgi:hypothetical protein